MMMLRIHVKIILTLVISLYAIYDQGIDVKVWLNLLEVIHILLPLYVGYCLSFMMISCIFFYVMLGILGARNHVFCIWIINEIMNENFMIYFIRFTSFFIFVGVCFKYFIRILLFLLISFKSLHLLLLIIQF